MQPTFVTDRADSVRQQCPSGCGWSDIRSSPPTDPQPAEVCTDQPLEFPVPPDVMTYTDDLGNLDLLAMAAMLCGIPTGQGDLDTGEESQTDLVEQFNTGKRTFDDLEVDTLLDTSFDGRDMDNSLLDVWIDSSCWNNGDLGGPDRKRRRIDAAGDDQRLDGDDDGGEFEDDVGECEGDGSYDDVEDEEMTGECDGMEGEDCEEDKDCDSDGDDDDGDDDDDDDEEDEDEDDDDDDDDGDDGDDDDDDDDDDDSDSTDSETDSSSDSSDEDDAIPLGLDAFVRKTNHIPCPPSCVCQTGQQRRSIPKIKRKFQTVQPLLQKLLRRQTLNRTKMYRSPCCHVQCCRSWRRISAHKMVSQYHPSDLRVTHYSWGTWKSDDDDDDDDDEDGLE